MKRGLFAAILLLLMMHGPAVAQLPRVGSIDFYGLRVLKPVDLVAAIGVEIGDTLTLSSEAASRTIRERLRQVNGIADADVSFVCCDAGRALMYVGVREAGSASLAFAPEPTGDDRLPEEMLAAEREFLRHMMDAVRRNDAEEDDSAGHSLLRYAPARAVQERFIAFAAGNLRLVRSVLHNSSDAQHRAIAAQIIAYVPDKTAVVDDLVRAARDANAEVRNNAVRALGVMAAAGISVPLEPFIELMSSVDWTDRNKASFVLTAITANRDTATLNVLRTRAFDALLEMARWRFIGHAAPAGIILGRIAGIPENEIFPKLMRNRDEVISAALKLR